MECEYLPSSLETELPSLLEAPTPNTKFGVAGMIACGSKEILSSSTVVWQEANGNASSVERASEKKASTSKTKRLLGNLFLPAQTLTL